jgi:peptidoglycan biosynthesis protein MviN/MurJ (putative lipid II flippase)
MGVVNLGLSLALVRPMGILGVAVGTAVPNVVFAGTLLALACRELEVPVSRYVAYVAGRASLGTILPLATLLFLKHSMHVAGFVPLLAAGLASTIVFAIAWVGFVYRGDPHLDLRLWPRRRRAP